MCGIVGYLGISDESIAARFASACRLQSHRGPDDSDIHVIPLEQNRELRLGHQRLAIIDLSAGGHQPMYTADKQAGLIYNGEIYNYVELRSQLVAEGVEFTGRCDSEVLLQALKNWGVTRTLGLLNGMWAFAYFDRQEGSVWLSRDRFGKKPLFISTREEGIYFASEAKSLLKLVDARFPLNTQVLGEYLIQHQISTSSDYFLKGVKQIDAGTAVRIELSSGSSRKINYWSPTREIVRMDDDTKLAGDVTDLFFDSVRLRLRSDVPVGLLLSGGIDSTAIGAAIKELGVGDVRLLSAVDSDPHFDESKYIDIAAKHLGLPVQKVNPSLLGEMVFNELEDAVYFNDQPFGSFSQVSHYLLMRIAAENGIKVVLTGQGADELLCGYPKYLGFQVQQLLRSGSVLNAIATLSGFLWNRSVLPQFSISRARRYIPWVSDSSSTNYVGDLFSDYAPLQLGLARGKSVVDRQWEDVQRYSVPALLHSEDRMGMAHSREVRAPFLDYRLVELLLSLPIEKKLRRGWTKYIFRKALSDYMPGEITWRRDKQGFVNSQSEWIKTTLRERILDDYFASDSRIFQYGIIQRQKLLSTYRAFCEQPPDRGSIWFRDIFAPLTLEVWLRHYDNFIDA